MPRRDMFPDIVKKALIADGWRITHDPLHIPFGGLDFIVFDDVQEVIVQWIESTNIDKS